jgi:hypothetical protein
MLYDNIINKTFYIENTNSFLTTKLLNKYQVLDDILNITEFLNKRQIVMIIKHNYITQNM